MLKIRQIVAIALLLGLAIGLAWFDSSSEPKPFGHPHDAQNITAAQAKQASDDAQKERSDAAIAR